MREQIAAVEPVFFARASVTDPSEELAKLRARVAQLEASHSSGISHPDPGVVHGNFTSCSVQSGRGGAVADEGGSVAGSQRGVPLFFCNRFAAPDRGSRLQEDFVPMCDENVVRWMRGRQADMQDATAAGNAHELARFCPVVATRSTGVVTDVNAFNGRKGGLGPLRNSIGRGTSQHSVEVRSRYGMRGVRVGEASNPGPKKRRRRVTSSPDPTDSDFFAFLDGFEQDLCPVVLDGDGTQLDHTVIQSPDTTLVEESGKPSS